MVVEAKMTATTCRFWRRTGRLARKSHSAASFLLRLSDHYWSSYFANCSSVGMNEWGVSPHEQTERLWFTGDGVINNVLVDVRALLLGGVVVVAQDGWGCRGPAANLRVVPAHTRARTNIHTHAQTLHAHTRKNTHAHARKHKHAHVHTSTNTHAHTR